MKKHRQPLQDASRSFTTPKYGFKSWFELRLLFIKMFFRNRRFLRRRTAFRRRSGGVAGKFARGMQNRALTYVKKRYTKVFVAAVAEDDDVYERTVSHIHNRNSFSADPENTITLYDVDQDDQLGTDMELYQYAKITGVSIKMLFPEGTTPECTPVQWSLGYSNLEIIAPELGTDRLQTLATFQTSSCQARKPVTRYFRTGAALAR